MKLIDMTSNLMVEDVSMTVKYYERARHQVDLIQDMSVTFYGMREFCIKDPNGYFLTFAEPV
jgi:uncharacterized glyoxalase superfamily protein PhnB